jgi:hypothetical protein
VAKTPHCNDGFVQNDFKGLKEEAQVNFQIITQQILGITQTKLTVELCFSCQLRLESKSL